MHEMRQIFRRGGEKTLYPLWDTLKGKSEILCEMRRENECGCRSEGVETATEKVTEKMKQVNTKKTKRICIAVVVVLILILLGKTVVAAIELYGRLPCGRGLCGCL